MGDKLTRNSSIELYRILATFSVLIVHYYGWFVGGIPEEFDFSNISAFRVGQLAIGSLCAICVNCFLLISGYFAIKTSLKSVYKYILLLIGMYVPMYLANGIITDSFSVKGLISSALAISGGGYFVQCYFMLMLISPIINSFIATNKRRTVLFFTLLFILVEFYFADIRSIDNFGVSKGYSVVHFCLMYMVGRTVFLYKDELIQIKRRYWLYGYILFSLATALLYLARVSFAFDYSSPFVILAAVCSFVPFLYQDFVNKKINWIAKSTFAVYILQVTNPLYSLLVKVDNGLLSSYSYGIYLLLGGSIIVIFFLLCILYDKGREYVTNLFSDRLYNLINRCVEYARDVFCRC